LAIPRGCFIADDPDARKPIEIIGADWILLVIDMKSSCTRKQEGSARARSRRGRSCGTQAV
jgi:hypothetical protein